MAQAAASDRGANLRQRILSALVLGPLVLGAVVAGRPWLDLLVAAAAAVLAWEWARLCQDGRFGLPGGLLLVETLGCIWLAALYPSPWAVAVFLAGLLVVVLSTKVAGSPRAGWMGAGCLYIGLPCVALIWLRSRPATGLDLVVLVMIATWAADIGAYAAGRMIGGPRLAPRISPGKTWSGLLGGLVAAGAVGAIYAGLRHSGGAATVAGISVALGLAAAAGDLLESAAKRRFHVKDAGSIIPGHGGLLDRVDGLLLAAAILALLVVAGWDFPR